MISADILGWWVFLSVSPVRTAVNIKKLNKIQNATDVEIRVLGIQDEIRTLISLSTKKSKNFNVQFLKI